MWKLKKFSEGVWFDYPEVKGVRLKIKPIQTADIMLIQSRIRRSIPTEVPIPGDPTRTVITLMEDMDYGKLSFETFCAVLEDFEGITGEDEKGNIINDKLEIKRMLFGERKVRDFISQKSESLLAGVDQRVEEELKNLPSSQSG